MTERLYPIKYSIADNIKEDIHYSKGIPIKTIIGIEYKARIILVVNKSDAAYILSRPNSIIRYFSGLFLISTFILCFMMAMNSLYRLITDGSRIEHVLTILSSICIPVISCAFFKVFTFLDYRSAIDKETVIVNEFLIAHN